MIALLSRDPSLYSTQVIREAFEQDGHEISVFDTLQLEVKVGSGVYYQGQPLTPSYVIPRFSGPILLAGLAVLREWQRAGVPLLNSPQSVALAHDQLATLQALATAGLPIPETSFCSQPRDQATYDSLTAAPPKVIKLLDSSQGNGVTLARDEQTARSVLSTLATLRSSGITQTFYPEAAGADTRILVLHGEVIASITRQAQEGEFRANLHQGGSITNATPPLAQCELAIQACAALGLNFAGVDLIETAQGPRLLELNASPGLEGIEQGNPGSIARLLVEHLPG